MGKKSSNTSSFANKLLSTFIALVMVAGLSPATALADEQNAAGESRGTADSLTPPEEEELVSQTSTSYAILYSDGTLVFQQDNAHDVSHGTVVGEWSNFESYNRFFWHGEDYRDLVKKAEFTESFTLSTSTAHMFEGCANLTEVKGLDKLNTSSVQDMSNMFYGCSSLKSIDMSSFDTGNVTNTGYMFFGCAALEQVDISSLKVKVHTTYPNDYAPNYYAMFLDCPALKSVKLGSDYHFYDLRTQDIDYASNTLPTPSSTAPYTGKWVKEGASAGATAYTAENLATAFNNDPTGMAGTWVWQEKGAVEPVKTSITGATVSLSSSSFTFNGEVQKPTVASVKLANGTVVPADSYDVSYVGTCTDAATYTVTVTGKGNYEGSAYTSFTIAKKPLASDMIDAIADQSFTGSAVEPTVVVRMGSSVVPATNYSVSYQNNTAIGTAKVTVAASDNTNFSGSASKDFNIVSVTREYQVQRDTWGFANYSEWMPKQYCIDMFGSVKGEQIWKEDKPGNGGNCFGMSTTSAASAHGMYPAASAYTYGSQQATSLYGVGDAYWTISGSTSELNGKTAKELIFKGQLLQWNEAISAEVENNMIDRASGMNLGNLANLVAAVRESVNGGEPVVIGAYGLIPEEVSADGRIYCSRVGHALLVLGIKSDDSAQTVLSIYDCNDPGNARELILNKSGSTYTGWYYQIADKFRLNWGSAVNIIDGVNYSGISWCTPGDDFESFMKGSASAGDGKKLFSTSSAVTVKASGGATYELDSRKSYAGNSNITPIADFDDEADSMEAQALPVTGSTSTPADVSGASVQENSGGQFWTTMGDEVSIPSMQAGSVSMASDKSSVSVETGASGSVSMRVSDTADNTATVNFSSADSDTFTIEYSDESSQASDGVNTIVVKGTAASGGSVATAQSGNDVKVAGVTSLTVTNDGDKTQTFGSLDPSKSYTVYPTAGSDGTPTLRTVENYGWWGTCKWEYDSAGVITVYPGTGTDLDSYYQGEGASPWKAYKNTATKVVFAEENGKKVVFPANCNGMFYSFGNLTEVDMTGADTSGVTNMESMFNGCNNLTSVKLENMSTAKATNMASMFRSCSQLQSLDLTGFDTSNVTDMSFMFAQCSSLKSVDLSSFNTAKLDQNLLGDTYLMFLDCNALEHVSLGANTKKLYELKSGYYSWNWRSMKDNQVYTSDQILSSRMGIADSYVKSTIAGSQDLTYAYIEGPADVTYTGGAQEPAVTVKMYGQTLTKGTHYTATYSNNTAVGTATVQVSGISPYNGTISREFTVKQKPSTPSTTTPSRPSYQTMYRLYNPYSGEHFYTANTGERDHLVSVGWRYEGEGWKAPLSGQDVYRLYNPYAGDHHYTPSAAERDSLVRVGWRYEGVGWKSGGSTPLYRQYNPYAEVGTHNYTTSKAENDNLVRVGWRAEGVGWYGV